MGERPEVALTFDAGAAAEPARRILETLKRTGLKATFFLTGQWVRSNPALARRIVEEGHEIGNHSWDHADFTRLSDAQIRDQLGRTEEEIRRTTGRSSRPYFRPPLGARNRRVRELVANSGYFTVYWSLDSRDSVDKGITAAQIEKRVVEGIAPGAIVLLHCGSEPSAEALDSILEGMRRRGLQQVTLSKLLQG